MYKLSLKDFEKKRLLDGLKKAVINGWMTQKNFEDAKKKLKLEGYELVKK